MRSKRRAPQLRYLAEDAMTGYTEASLRLVKALRDVGTRIEYRAWRPQAPNSLPPIRRHGRDQRPRSTVAPDAPTIAHTNPDHYLAVRELVGGPLIGHTVWETDRLPDRWPALANRVDGVVVPCEWNREVFADSGVTAPISVVPHVACDPVPGDRGKPLDLPDDVVVFYTIARWDPRKAPWLALRAFLDAFTADDPVAMVVKTTHGLIGTPSGDWGTGTRLHGSTSLEVARVIREYPRPAHVRLEAGDVSEERIAGIHARGDCYVSLALGEGWGLGAFDACAYGNPVVTTGWSGHLEYLDPEVSGLVDYDLVPARYYSPLSYTPDQRWAEPSLDHAVELLRAVAADPERARRRVAPQRERVLRDYAAPAVAAQFLAVVEALA